MRDLDIAQPDLFGDYDREQERRAAYREWFDNPPPCPACGTQEPNGMLLQGGHGFGMDGTICGWKLGEHPNFGGMCTAQYYTRNHVWNAVIKWWPAAQLDREIARARELNLDPGPIIAEAKQHRPQYRQWMPPGHRYVSLGCDQCSHPMGQHRQLDGGGTRCVKGCKCDRGPYLGYPHHSHYDKCLMWQRDHYIAQQGAN